MMLQRVRGCTGTAVGNGGADYLLKAQGIRGQSLLERLIDDYESQDRQDPDHLENIKYVVASILTGKRSCLLFSSYRNDANVQVSAAIDTVSSFSYMKNFMTERVEDINRI